MAKFYYQKYSLKMDLPADPGSSERVIGSYYLVSRNQTYTSSTKTAYFSEMELSKPLQIGEMKSASTGKEEYSTGKWTPYPPRSFITSDCFVEYNSSGVIQKFAKFISASNAIAPEKYDGTFMGLPKWYPIKDVSQFENILGKDEFIEYVIGEENEFPENGAQGKFWYVRDKRVFPRLVIKGRVATGMYINTDQGKRWVSNLYINDSQGRRRNLI